MKHYIRQKTDNSIQYTRHLIHKPRSIVLSKGHLTRNTFKSNIFMLINKLIVKFYVHGSLGVLQSWYLAYWWVSNCFFHELSYVKSLDFGPTFFVVIFNVICLTINNLSGILDTTDTNFLHPCTKGWHWKLLIHYDFGQKTREGPAPGVRIHMRPCTCILHKEGSSKMGTD